MNRREALKLLGLGALGLTGCAKTDEQTGKSALESIADSLEGFANWAEQSLQSQDNAGNTLKSPEVVRQTLRSTDGRELAIPVGGQLFHSNHRQGESNVDDYAVVFDPSQSGSFAIEPNGWWYQPFLPNKKQPFDVPIIVPEGKYQLIGPEVKIWHNQDGKHPWEKGNLIADHNGIFDIPATDGATNIYESYLAVKQDHASDAGGFSLARLEPLPWDVTS